MIKKTNIVLAVCLTFSFFTVACSEKPSSKAEKATTGKYEMINVPVGAKAYEVNTHKSSLKWKGTKLLKTRGHEGTLGLQEHLSFHISQ